MQAASISSKQNQISMAYENARSKTSAMRADHGDTSYAIRDVILGMLKKSADGNKIAIAPGIARRLVAEANAPFQRVITPDRIYDAKQSILGGYWNEDHSIHAVLLDGGAFWIVNGQTRLQAIAECGRAVTLRFVVQRVADEHEARVVFTQFDRKTGVRTQEQILNASGLTEEMDLPRKVTGFLFTAVGIINNGMVIPGGGLLDEASIAARNMDNKLRWVSEWAGEARMYLDDIGDARGTKRSALMRAGTMAVALMTYRHQREKAHQFWPRVADQANLRKYDPRNTLAQDIGTRNARNGHRYQSIQQSALAWNAYMRGRDLKSIRIADDWTLHLEGIPIKERK